MLCIQFQIVAVAFQCEEVVFFKNPPPLVTYFCPALVPPLGGYGWNTLTNVHGHEYFIPNKL